MAELHKVKQETFDIARRINIDPKGFTRAVDAYELIDTQPGGDRNHPALYMRRPTPGHPRFYYLESWLLPHLDIRLNKFHFFPGVEPKQDIYIDIAFIDCGAALDIDATTPATWHTRDLYVDIVTHLLDDPSGLQSQYIPGTHPHAKVQVLDLDELGEALVAGYITATEVQRALNSSQRLVDGLHEYGSVSAWLGAEVIDLHWLPEPPAMTGSAAP